MNSRFLISLIFILSSCSFDRSNNEINLIIKAANGDLEGVVHYSKKVDSLNFVSIKGDTPLCAAVHSGNFEVVKYLVESGALVEFEDSRGRTPLDVSREKGYESIYIYLRDIWGQSKLTHPNPNNTVNKE